MQEQNAQNMHALTDEKLIALIGNSADAVTELLLRYRGMVLYYSGQYVENVSDTDDFAQEGLLALLSAAASYQPEGKAGFRTYAAACIRNRIRNAARSAKRDVLSEDSLDDPESHIADRLAAAERDPEQELLAKEWVSELDKLMNQTLSKREREIFCCSLRGLSYDEIVQRMQISRKSVDNAIQRARRKLRAAWSELNGLS